MKIQIISDTHFEHYPVLEESFLKRIINVEDKKDTVLIMAGDIASIDEVPFIVDFYEQYFKNVLHICGNHECYGSNVVSDCKSVVVDDVEFVMATLWTNFRDNPVLEVYAGGAINDFRWIRNFRPSNSTRMFYQHLDFIHHCLENKQAEKQVVVTHFAPTSKSVHPKYAGQMLNGYFVNELDEYVMDCGVPLWIHGHCHDPFDYTMGDTRVVCNPYGYSTERTVHNPNLVIEI